MAPMSTTQAREDFSDSAHHATPAQTISGPGMPGTSTPSSPSSMTRPTATSCHTPMRRPHFARPARLRGPCTFAWPARRTRSRTGLAPGARTPRDGSSAAHSHGPSVPDGTRKRLPAGRAGAPGRQPRPSRVTRRTATPQAELTGTHGNSARRARGPRSSPARTSGRGRAVTRGLPAARRTLLRALFRPLPSRDNTAHESAGSRARPRGRLVAAVVRRRQRGRAHGRGRPGARRGVRCRAVRRPGHPR